MNEQVLSQALSVRLTCACNNSSCIIQHSNWIKHILFMKNAEKCLRPMTCKHTEQAFCAPNLRSCYILRHFLKLITIISTIAVLNNGQPVNVSENLLWNFIKSLSSTCSYASWQGSKAHESLLNKSHKLHVCWKATVYDQHCLSFIGIY